MTKKITFMLICLWEHPLRTFYFFFLETSFSPKAMWKTTNLLCMWRYSNKIPSSYRCININKSHILFNVRLLLNIISSLAIHFCIPIVYLNTLNLIVWLERWEKLGNSLWYFTSDDGDRWWALKIKQEHFHE